MHIYSNTNDHDKETPCPVKASTKLSTLNISDHTVYSKKGSGMVSKSQLTKIYLVVRPSDTPAKGFWSP